MYLLDERFFVLGLHEVLFKVSHEEIGELWSYRHTHAVTHALCVDFAIEREGVVFEYEVKECSGNMNG